jgi:hypothetical protein
MKNLLAKWDETEAHWRDQVRHDFEDRHIEPLHSQVSTTLRGMAKLAEVLSRVRRDCS